MKKYILISIITICITGCAKLPSATVTSVEQAGVQGAAIYVGTQYPNTIPIILSVSNYVINAANNGITVTPEQINAEVIKLEESNRLTVAEKTGINTFLVTLQPLIAQELASKHLDFNSNITIELCWVAQWASNILGSSIKCAVQPILVSVPTVTK